MDNVVSDTETAEKDSSITARDETRRNDDPHQQQQLPPENLAAVMMPRDDEGEDEDDDGNNTNNDDVVIGDENGQADGSAQDGDDDRHDEEDQQVVENRPIDILVDNTNAEGGMFYPSQQHYQHLPPPVNHQYSLQSSSSSYVPSSWSPPVPPVPNSQHTIHHHPSQQQQQQLPPQPPLPLAHPGLLHFYEAQMRDHAAAYANAAAAAAMTAAQIAANIASRPRTSQFGTPPPPQSLHPGTTPPSFTSSPVSNNPVMVAPPRTNVNVGNIISTGASTSPHGEVLPPMHGPTSPFFPSNLVVPHHQPPPPLLGHHHSMMYFPTQSVEISTQYSQQHQHQHQFPYQHHHHQYRGDCTTYIDIAGSHRGQDDDDDDDKDDDDCHVHTAHGANSNPGMYNHRSRKRQQRFSSNNSNNYNGNQNWNTTTMRDTTSQQTNGGGTMSQHSHNQYPPQEQDYFSQDDSPSPNWMVQSSNPSFGGGGGTSRNSSGGGGVRGSNSHSSTRNNRHQPPSPWSTHPTMNNTSCTPPSERRGRRRPRFWNETGSSDSDAARHFHHNNNNNNHNINTSNNNNNSNDRRRNRKMAMVASSSSDGGSATWITKKKARQPSDESLLGKTGISALYEWCHKRRTTPTFEMQVYGGISGGGGSSQSNLKLEDKMKITQQEQQQQYHDPAYLQEGGKRSRSNVEMFEVTVSIDGMEMGKGRAVTKALAKHHASRHALQVLLPGVEFDEDAGILTKLPSPVSTRKIPHHSTGFVQNSAFGGEGPQKKQQQQPCLRHIPNMAPSAAATSTASSLEELAPNLAKQLAIGHGNGSDEDDDVEIDEGVDGERKDGRPIAVATKVTKRDVGIADASRKRQKMPYAYPGTSTTSDDEDEDVYYASRGASVCSSLLHVMVQIDDRLSEAPQYTYQLESTTPIIGSLESSQLKRKAGAAPIGTNTTMPTLRGSFRCTGTLRLLLHDDESFASGQRGQPQQEEEADENYKILQAVAVAGSKRAARHSVAAKLLAMLFPECDGMAQVKEAAEAARDRYSISRAQKQQTRREKEFTQFNSYLSGSDHDDKKTDFSFAMAPETSPPLPALVDKTIAATLSRLPRVDSDSSLRQSNNNDSPLETSPDESELKRQLSRQSQLDERVIAALLKLNEHDEVGRSLPEQVTVDDVGRTVLRQATAEDTYWIDKLFGFKSSHNGSNGRSPMGILGAEKESSSTALRLWSSSTVILLLCRAIAPHEDPPLGCAVLTLGFSMKKGRILRVSQIASKPHLPRERFIECLHSLSDAMGCSLETTQMNESSHTSLRKDCIYKILNSHLLHGKHHREESQINNDTPSRPMEESLLKSSLQSVQEEGEGVDDSDSSSHKQPKHQDKPSKRSRVE